MKEKKECNGKSRVPTRCSRAFRNETFRAHLPFDVSLKSDLSGEEKRTNDARDERLRAIRERRNVSATIRTDTILCTYLRPNVCTDCVDIFAVCAASVL